MNNKPTENIQPEELNLIAAALPVRTKVSAGKAVPCSNCYRCTRD